MHPMGSDTAENTYDSLSDFILCHANSHRRPTEHHLLKLAAC